MSTFPAIYKFEDYVREVIRNLNLQEIIANQVLNRQT